MNDDVDGAVVIVVDEGEIIRRQIAGAAGGAENRFGETDGEDVAAGAPVNECDGGRVWIYGGAVILFAVIVTHLADAVFEEYTSPILLFEV